MITRVSRWLTLCISAVCISSVAQGVNITGTVRDQDGKPIPGATVLLTNANLRVTTDAAGAYAISAQAVTRGFRPTGSYERMPVLINGRLFFNLRQSSSRVRVSLSDLKGRTISTLLDRNLPSGDYEYRLPPAIAASQLGVLLISLNGQHFHSKTLLCSFGMTGVTTDNSTATHTGLHKAASVLDTLVASCSGYRTARQVIDSYTATCDFTLTAGISVIAKHHKIEGRLSTTTFRSVGNYGIAPAIMLAANPDNSFDIAWHDASAEKVHILKCDSLGEKTGEIHPSCISGAGRAVGFARIPDDDSYVVGYAKDNSFGNDKFEFWITRFNSSGNQIYSTRIFGEKSTDEVWAKGEPGRASSGRIAYNPASKRVAFYTGHSMKWDDNVRHQGGYMGFLDEQGTQLKNRDDWYCSHNFDQRLLLHGGFFYTLAHGDAYPRSLVFGQWSDDPAVTKFHPVNAEYFKIPGATGDNTTNTQTGGMVWLHDTTISTPVFTGPVFGVVYGTKIGRTNYDICFKRITGGGTVLDSVWLTTNTASQFSMFPRIARFDDGNILVAWRQSSGTSITTQAMLLDYRGQTILPPSKLDVPLSEYYDLVNLPNGDIVWATSTAADTLGVFRIPVH